ncbi:ABC transporter ATP-binding protein [Actinomycetospora cinnamomea]|uniref:Peptide/nickel transport system ATP-binding protein n=1 Tax=Actinomycetospora cinnamomea TaxID=663609 RepID=A0A2U1FMA6_9PSEU|nr:ATP-binding cassette domain-containing protein [Actinomycetospora cinnamomea]PVZ13289.1 peptide/nickel transport system ATP-binding protein [Actinomycetospora cinnamomea]
MTFSLAGVTRRYSVPGDRPRPWRRGVTRTALDGLDLEVPTGRDLAIVGASGSGKSTLLRVLLALEAPDAGTVRFRGDLVTPRAPGALRHAVGVVAQDPASSLDPRLPVGASIREPLECLRVDGDHGARVAQLLDAVGLDPAVAARRPAAFSGGERQRIALARALAAGPEVLVADEPFSAVDPTTRARLVALVDDLTRAGGTQLLLVSHDLGIAQRLCADVAVLDASRVVETGPVATVFARPSADATRALLGAVLPVEWG